MGFTSLMAACSLSCMGVDAIPIDRIQISIHMFILEVHSQPQRGNWVVRLGNALNRRCFCHSDSHLQQQYICGI